MKYTILVLIVSLLSGIAFANGANVIDCVDQGNLAKAKIQLHYSEGCRGNFNDFYIEISGNSYGITQPHKIDCGSFGGYSQPERCDGAAQFIFQNGDDPRYFDFLWYDEKNGQHTIHCPVNPY